MKEVSELMSTKKKNGFDEWEIRDAARSLRDAQKVRENPKLLKLAEAQLQKDIKESEDALALEQRTAQKLKETFNAKKK